MGIFAGVLYTALPATFIYLVYRRVTHDKKAEPPKPTRKTYNRGDELTLGEALVFRVGKCPDCGSSLAEGPHGGLSVNYYCASGRCGSGFNDMGPIGIERITDAGILGRTRQGVPDDLPEETTMEERHHSPEELKNILEKMQEISDMFYDQAVHVGNHAFIEFAGLMNEYIKMCRETATLGKDFTTTNRHVGQELVMRRYHAVYLAEKFECIFGTTFQANPEFWTVFQQGVMGK